MRLISEGLDAEVAGTSSGDFLEITAWRGLQVPVRVPVEAWSAQWDGGRQVQGQATITVADPDGELSPYGMGDLLAPGGSRVTIVWVSGTSGLRVPWGCWRLRTTDPREVWRVPAAGLQRVLGGSSIVLRADEDPMATAAICRLDSEPVRTGTSLGEVRRLMADIGIAVTVGPGVTDRGVPTGLVYDTGRMDAIEDHLTRLNATYRMAPDGSFEVVSLTPTVPVWTIAGGEEGALIEFGRTLSDDGIYNAATSTAEIDLDGQRRQLVGRAYLRTGPLAWDGPFGPAPIFHQSPATSQAGVDSDAATLLANRVASGEVVLRVECLLHPALQIHDWVTVVPATVAGDESLSGRVVSMATASISGSGSTPIKTMTLGVAVSTQALEVIARRVAQVRG